jgi:nucleoside phosphorylase
MMFVCAGESEQFEFAEPIGVGMVDAAVNLTNLCREKEPDSIVFVGTAGSYGSRKIFDIVESNISCNIELGYFDNKSYSPIDSRITSKNIQKHKNVSCETIVNSSNYITIDSDAAKQFLAHGIELENMEFYAVLKVANKFSIPALGVFCVTNYCDVDAHKDFILNQSEAMGRLSRYIEDNYE